MTDLQILLIVIGCASSSSPATCALRPGAAMNALEVAGRRSRRRSSSSTCCGRCCAPRTSDRGPRRLPDARHARARDRARHAVPRAVHPPGHGGRARLPQPDRPAASSARSTASAASTRPPSRAGRATRSPCSSMALVAIVAGYVVLRLQDVLPLNQGGIPADDARTSRSTRRSASRPTRTGRTTRARPARRYLTQAAVLAVRNFTSAATGLAIAIALFRGLTRRSTKTLGNYWVDLTRGVLYILLPISIVGALVLVWQGVPQTWDPTADRHDAPGRPADHRARPDRLPGVDQGAGQQRRRLLQRQLRPSVREPDAADRTGSRSFALLICPFALTYTFGRYAGSQRQGWTIFGAMAAILLVGAVVAMHVEFAGNPLFPAGVDQAGARQHGGQGGPLRRRRRRPVHGRRRPARAPARSTPGTTAPSRSPASSRCSTWSSARSRRAASAPACTGCSSSARSSPSSSPA